MHVCRTTRCIGCHYDVVQDSSAIQRANCRYTRYGDNPLRTLRATGTPAVLEAKLARRPLFGQSARAHSPSNLGEKAVGPSAHAIFPRLIEYE
jgi:hypothetical protein